MAIDSAEKRRSAMGVSLRVPGVTPNPAQDQEWRMQAGYAYSGTLITPLAAPDSFTPIRMGHRQTNAVEGGTIIGW